MSARADALARQFEEATNELIATIEACPDEKWKAVTPNDGRTVNVVAHHIAMGDVPISGFVGSIANGQGLPNVTPEMIDQSNAEHAKQQANISKEQVIADLRANCASAAALVRGLSDEQLDRTGSAFGRDWTTQQVIEMVLIGHTKGHLDTIRAAL
jgi:uncharacterized damage-inducible protein DinB